MNRILCVMALLCLIFNVQSQDLIPLLKGDSVPVLTITNVLNHKSNEIKLNESNNELIILEFISTHCGTCIKSVEHLEHLQREIGKRLRIILVTSQKRVKIQEVITKYNWTLPIAVEDTDLRKLFPHQTVPHQVWIKNNRIIAITNWVYANKHNIEKVLAGHEIPTNLKQEEEIDISKPLLESVTGLKPYYHSLITPAINNGAVGFRKSGNTLLLYNQTIEGLYSKAFQLPVFPRGAYTILEVPDSMKAIITGPENWLSGNFQEDQKYFNWQEKYTFCYELTLDSKKKLLECDFLEIMKSDLNNFFGYHLGIMANIEQRDVECLALVRNRESHTQQPKGGKSSIINNDTLYQQVSSSLDLFLINIAGKNSELNMPVINDTGFDGKINLQISGGLGDLENVNQQLQPIGLRFEKKTVPIDMLVIRKIDKE